MDDRHTSEDRRRTLQLLDVFERKCSGPVHYLGQGSLSDLCCFVDDSGGNGQVDTVQVHVGDLDLGLGALREGWGLSMRIESEKGGYGW